MKSLMILLMACYSFTLSSYAQRTDEQYVITADTVYRFQGIIPPLEFQYELNKIFSDPITNHLPIDILFDDNPSTIWLRTELLVSNRSIMIDENEINTHFTSSLYQKHLKDSEFDMVRYVLGMAQLSAVAYLAYRHIKKYGFWK